MIPQTERNHRRRALRAADASCDREELPPTSRLAKELGEEWINGELSGDEVVAELASFYSKNSK
ncbi:hypothetical protein GYB61_11405 [bacterium]|nr:hypothetical protein [bacterium]